MLYDARDGDETSGESGRIAETLKAAIEDVVPLIGDENMAFGGSAQSDVAARLVRRGDPHDGATRRREPERHDFDRQGKGPEGVDDLGLVCDDDHRS